MDTGIWRCVRVTKGDGANRKSQTKHTCLRIRPFLLASSSALSLAAAGTTVRILPSSSAALLRLCTSIFSSPFNYPSIAGLSKIPEASIPVSILDGISQVSQGIDSVETRIDSYPKN
jgi:hypothetical protein